jgi:DNA-binding protein H-NS
MPTLVQIQARIAKLQLQADAIAAKQVSAVLNEITTLMAKHGVTSADIDAHLSTKKRRGRPAGKKTATRAAVKTNGKKRGRPSKASTSSAGKSKLPAKYLNPKTGETWSGWARPPAWIKDVKDRTKFLIDGAAAAVASEPATRAKKTRAKSAGAKKTAARKTPVKRTTPMKANPASSVVAS